MPHSEMPGAALDSVVERMARWVGSYFSEVPEPSAVPAEVGDGLCEALSDAITVSSVQGSEWGEDGYAFDGVLPAVIARSSPSNIRVVGAAVLIRHRESDLMLPLLADLDRDLGSVVVRIGGLDRAIAYRDGGEVRFAGVTEDDSWPYVLHFTLP